MRHVFTLRLSLYLSIQARAASFFLEKPLLHKNTSISDADLRGATVVAAIVLSVLIFHLVALGHEDDQTDFSATGGNIFNDELVLCGMKFIRSVELEMCKRSPFQRRMDSPHAVD